MERKAYTFLVEVIFERMVTDAEGGKSLRLETNLLSFSDDNESRAYNAAKAELDRIQRNGLKLTGGAIVLSFITPGAIKQVGIINLNQYEATHGAEASTETPPSEDSTPESAPELSDSATP